MTERERKARVFPQGWDWFWGLAYAVLAGYQIAIGSWWGVLTIILGLLLLWMRWFDRVLTARLADLNDELDVAFNQLINSLKEIEHGEKTGKRR